MRFMCRKIRLATQKISKAKEQIEGGVKDWDPSKDDKVEVCLPSLFQALRLPTRLTSCPRDSLKVFQFRNLRDHCWMYRNPSRIACIGQHTSSCPERGIGALQGDPFKTLFVGRISFDATEKKLRREFEEYGPIKSIRLVHEKRSGDGALHASAHLHAAPGQERASAAA